ncbi:MAG: hypothetical protein M3P18_26805 [Actinomycetota bacterium]|nr:hypothetical protein [Actinomycetota bacterium]
MSSLVFGVAAANVTFVSVGYAILWPTLRQSTATRWLACCGVALLAGAGAIGITLSILAVVGLSVGSITFGVAAAVIACLGVGAGRYVAPPPELPGDRPARTSSVLELVLAASARTAVFVLATLIVIAGFRTAAWLDDSWTFWLPKGLLLTSRGLDPRPFSGGSGYETFFNADYPLWWSIIGGVDMRLVGRVDLRVLDAQVALLLVAFIGAVAQQLQRRVRPSILWLSLLLIVAAPELSYQALDGAADVPLAIYFAAAALAASNWVLRGESLSLWLTFLFAATAVNIKDEGAPLLVLCLFVPAVIASRHVPRRRVQRLSGVLAAALLTAVPWLVWRTVHGVSSYVFSWNSFNPSHLAGHIDRLSPSVRAVGHQLGYSREWFLIVPIFVVLTFVAALVDRQALWLVPVLGLALGSAFFVWVYWSGPIDLSFWLPTSAYRVVDSLVLSSAVAIPLIAEHLLRRASSRAVRAL